MSLALDIAYKHHGHTPHKGLLFGDSIAVTAYVDGEKVGGISAREVLDYHPRCWQMWSAVVRRDFRREGIGTALYLEAAWNIPGILIPDPHCSPYASALWQSLHRYGHTIHVEGPKGWTLALP